MTSGGGNGVFDRTVSWRGWEFLLTLVHVSYPHRNSGNCVNPAVYKSSALVDHLWSTARNFDTPKLIQEEEREKKRTDLSPLPPKKLNQSLIQKRRGAGKGGGGNEKKASDPDSLMGKFYQTFKER